MDKNIKYIIELIDKVIKFEEPTDFILKKYYKVHKNIGKQDRNKINKTIYTLLRNFEKITTAIIDKTDKTKYYALLSLYLSDEYQSNEALSLLNKINTIEKSTLLNIKAELPKPFIEILGQQYNQEEILKLGKFFNSMAPLDLRVNTIKTNRKNVLAQLEKENIQAIATKYSPWGIRLKEKIAITNLELYKKGYIEIQDEGSQLIAYFSNAKRNNLVIDFCAGSGGKTIAMGAIINNTGRIYAFDNNKYRLNNIYERINRAGLTNIYPILISNEKDIKLTKFINKADIVLVDAPCSGSGTIRRNPYLKYKINQELINYYQNIQKKILEQASNLLKSKGKLIYATCSIFQAENEIQIKDFLKNNKEFTLHTIKNNTLNKEDNNLLFLSPLKYNMDGFFIAIMTKN